MPELYADLAIPVAVDTLFTYRVPAELRSSISRGHRVIAPFGKRTVVGMVVKLSSTPPDGRQLKSVIDVIDAEPVLSEELLQLTEWISRYYFAPWGEVIKAALVQGATAPGKRTVRLAASRNGDVKVTPKEESLLKEISLNVGQSIQQLQRKTGIKSIYASLGRLIEGGHIIIEEKRPVTSMKSRFERVISADDEARGRWKSWLEGTQPVVAAFRLRAGQSALLRELSAFTGEYVAVTEFLKSRRTSLSSLRTLEKKGLIHFSTREVRTMPVPVEGYTEKPAVGITLNSRQQEAFNAIRAGIEQHTFATFLLHGVTGSGKTQVYIESIRVALDAGKTAIVLVPEISLTPQTVYRFRAHFGELVVSLHSRMSAAERYEAWRMIREKRFSVVIGPRSAIFAPLGHIGLIVVDEEHEGSFKQYDQNPRYNARDVAIMRASFAGAVVVLGSATPSIESYENAQNGKYSLLELPERVDVAKLPAIEIVDMTRERQQKLAAFRGARKAEFKENYLKAKANTAKLEFGLISDLLQAQIEDRLKKHEGIILLQNRRGFAPVIECLECGNVLTCTQCSISLTYHLAKKHCRCHYCGSVTPLPELCPACGSGEIKLRGFGTQRIEEELSELFPAAKILRMDLDTTTRRGSHHTILQKFADGGADILLGTQMVAKGLDFSRVTLVGVISADTQMLLPDFRAAERTFQLLTQVAGRAGRSALAGEVVIQTFQPQHYALKHVVGHDYVSFYTEELQYRKELSYPPYSRLAMLECRGENEREVMKHALMLGAMLKERKTGFYVLGPAPAALAKIKNRFRWHIVIKDLKSADPGGKRLREALTSVLLQYRDTPEGRGKMVELVVDVDPGGMM